MCGILGSWHAAADNAAAVEASLHAIVHRGPDDSGIMRRDAVVLAMRRLAIIDLSSGHQPIFNEDETVAVVCNGEIYNYQDLSQSLSRAGHRFATKSDTETLAHLYEDFGPAMCSQLRGMFAFAIYDAKRRLLMLGRDRFGKKPLYYARTPDGGLIFASELKALRPLAAAAGLALKPSPQAIYDYLSVGAVPQPATIYTGVEALPMGSWLTFDGHEVRHERYWSVDYSRVVDQSYEAILDGIRERVSEATRIRLRSDVPLGVFLSGGVDSSVVAREAARHVGPSLRTFTIAMDSAALDESARAARTAETLGVQHTILPSP